jgi:Flp pilus assembly protein TadD
VSGWRLVEIGSASRDGQRMRSPLLCIPLLLSLVHGCASAPLEQSTVTVAQLLEGDALFGTPIAAASDDSDRILALDDEMRAFVDERLRGVRGDSTRLQRLVGAMSDTGLLELGYDADATLTATEVFHSKKGNCLAATNLFVALARRAGLEVEFQDVEIPPVWIEEGGFVMLDQHVNALIRGTRRGGSLMGTDYVMDFNRPNAGAAFDVHPVSDAHAFALFYNNLAADLMRRGEVARAFAHLKRALAIDPRSVPAWVNLGALYSRQQHFDHAIGAYLQATRVEPSNRSALSNLANLHGYLGNTELAEQYRRAVAFHQNRNPYQQYAIAREAYLQATYEDALRVVNRAIRLKRDAHQFYHLRGLVLTKLGDHRGARESFIKAREVTPDADEKERYDAKLDALAHHSGYIDLVR